MRKITTLFILVLSMSFVSCDTFTHYVIRVSMDRHPILTIINQTGHPAVVTAPISSNVASGGITLFQPTGANRSIDVTYRIGEFQFTEQVTVSDQDVTVTLTRRPAVVTVVNQTGHIVNLTAPQARSVANEARTQFLTALNQTVNVTYRVGQMAFTEQVTVSDSDVTVILTRAPPTFTIVNNVGTTVSTLFLRAHGAPSWSGGNIVIDASGITQVRGGAVQAADITVSIINRDSMRIWTGDIPIIGERVDIRIDDVHGNTFVRSNVLITGDMTITFTPADRP